MFCFVCFFKLDIYQEKLQRFVVIPFQKTTGLLVVHFENIGLYICSSYSKYMLFTGFSIKNIG